MRSLLRSSRVAALALVGSLVALVAAGASCRSGAPRHAAPLPDLEGSTAAAAGTAKDDGARELRLLFTTDEHGWLLPLKDEDAQVERGGILALYDRLRRDEGYEPTPAARAAGYVLLSAGDMWTGPYETTVLEGAPMVAAMGHMGYAGAALGNHEFDFGVRVLAERAKASPFPFLAANLVERATGAAPPWAHPFAIVEAGGVKLGVIGLTNFDSPVTSDPRHLTGLEFKPYAAAIDEWAPKARSAGADELVVLVHDSLAAAPELLPALRRQRVRALAFGHHHQAATAIDDNDTPDLDDDIVVCNAGAYLRSYCRMDLSFVAGRMAARSVTLKQVEAPLGTAIEADSALAGIVAEAERSANQIGGEVLVENVRLLGRGVDGPLGQLVVDSWLQALPYAQVAITNAGGVRQDLAAGPVRMRDIVSVLPFNNYLLIVDLTGAQLKEVVASPESIVSGVRFSFKPGKDRRVIETLVDKDGKAIADDARLKVVINDFMYRGGDRYRFQDYDREPEETAIDWREPVLRLLRDLGRANQKLDLVADDRARRL
jgi:5'-nucleotidase / UDP-sugar diphosphatase